ncbi:coiled-coil domain-containing protein 43 [Brienomyrus brachyistius]|uniref:coiled-coil domain-containing protein 43 n=1 Tax=Brienomyrus brachyistius TaxID=42636 RepID=UPI0020B3E7EB|nr:coiled-coil domain-containing protein 43 [Brienomyrus brachyistius]
MAAPKELAGEFETWLNSRLDELEIDCDVYAVYILGVLQEEESDDEKLDALGGILSAFLDENSLEDVCREIIKQWTDSCALLAAKNCQTDGEVQAIANLIEKQAQIVVKQKEKTDDDKKRKEAVLAQYANVTDDDDEDVEEDLTGAACTFNSDKSLFKNTNVEDVLLKKRLQRDQARVDAQKKKEQDKMQREKDKLTKQERKEKEKKRTQKGERKR